MHDRHCARLIIVPTSLAKFIEKKGQPFDGLAFRVFGCRVSQPMPFSACRSLIQPSTMARRSSGGIASHSASNFLPT